MSQPFTIQERERIRYHLGYLNAQPAASIQFGQPKPIQTLFLVELAMDNSLDETRDRVRRIVGIMDGIEDQLVDAQAFLAAQQLDSLKPRPDHPDALDREYYRWACRLADNLGVPLYAYAQRFARFVFGGGMGGAGSIPVRR